MCMSLTRRFQILLDEDRYQRVADLAARRKVSVATVIREAIDRGLPDSDARRRAALRGLLDAEPMPVPERVEDLLAELDDARGRRA